jgi:hypothetical protein
MLKSANGNRVFVTGAAHGAPIIINIFYRTGLGGRKSLKLLLSGVRKKPELWVFGGKSLFSCRTGPQEARKCFIGLRAFKMFS